MARSRRTPSNRTASRKIGLVTSDLRLPPGSWFIRLLDLIPEYSEISGSSNIVCPTWGGLEIIGAVSILYVSLSPLSESGVVHVWLEAQGLYKYESPDMLLPSGGLTTAVSRSGNVSYIRNFFPPSYECGSPVTPVLVARNSGTTEGIIRIRFPYAISSPNNLPSTLRRLTEHTLEEISKNRRITVSPPGTPGDQSRSSLATYEGDVGRQAHGHQVGSKIER